MFNTLVLVAYRLLRIQCVGPFKILSLPSYHFVIVFVGVGALFIRVIDACLVRLVLK